MLQQLYISPAYFPAPMQPTRFVESRMTIESYWCCFSDSTTMEFHESRIPHPSGSFSRRNLIA